MKCFECSKGKLAKKLTDVSGEVRGEKYTVRCEAMVCDRCGFQVLSEEQSEAYTAAVSDAYRQRHGLLTSKAVRQIRSRLGMTQQAFADYLKVGVASVKRWESGLIQDPAMDELIRLKTDLSVARQNIKGIQIGLRNGGRLRRAGPIEPAAEQRGAHRSGGNRLDPAPQRSM